MFTWSRLATKLPSGLEGGTLCNSKPVAKSCEVCQKHRPSPQAAPAHPWVWPPHPWSRVHIDYAGPYLNHRFLLIVDAHSKWIGAFAMSSTTSFSTIEKLRLVFARFGVPEMLVSDNGTNFTSKEFQLFCTKNPTILHPTGLLNILYGS